MSGDLINPISKKVESTRAGAPSGAYYGFQGTRVYLTKPFSMPINMSNQQRAYQEWGKVIVPVRQHKIMAPYRFWRSRKNQTFSPLNTLKDITKAQQEYNKEIEQWNKTNPLQKSVEYSTPSQAKFEHKGFIGSGKKRRKKKKELKEEKEEEKIDIEEKIEEELVELDSKNNNDNVPKHSPPHSPIPSQSPESSEPVSEICEQASSISSSVSPPPPPIQKPDDQISVSDSSLAGSGTSESLPPPILTWAVKYLNKNV